MVKSTMKKKKAEVNVGELLTTLFSTIIEEFNTNQSYESILFECMKACITYASQNTTLKNTFAL